ncbi:E3 ubiquitin-protein ligase CCNB1IP1 isoform X2 [Nelusetta ayraudi]|uniref:E3 ubiquitin-protein ligase CCNB1IP1 isoform X2 n=1 Tax=Nelusetta ayraudi TaxID=303726 RepID=UPI003F6F5AC0
MSVCGDTLLCNFPKCRIKLSGFAWVTACSHVFCDQHGSGEFSRSPAICPACSSTLSGKLDIIRTELSPSEDYKAMVLAGLRPDIVLDISARALAFWTYQMMEDYKRKYSEVSERLMERNRQYQKLQGLYDSLRLRNMVVSAGERDTLLQPGQLNFRGGGAQPSSPLRSPQFFSMGHDGDSSTFFSSLEADTAKNFFQFSSPARERGRPFTKRH